MNNFFKERATDLGLSPDDIAFELRRDHEVQITTMAVRGWLTGKYNPAIELAEPLARVLRTTKAKILNAMNELAVARKEAATAGK